MNARLLLKRRHMVSHQENSLLLLDAALFCEENCEDEGDRFLGLFGQNLSWDDEELSSLLQKEQETQLQSGVELEENPCVYECREEAVEWILRVVGYYSFSALTAVLAVNYLDRFLYGFGSPHCREKPWMTQLAAVACLSLAAKVDETQVPLLLDLQVEESKYVFEAKTIQRMEILILSTLEWKMNPVTPLAFLDYIAFKTHLSREFLTRCESLILSVISDSRFMGYLPSALATSTMIYVITSVNPCIGFEHQDQLVAILGINKEKVHDCCGLLQEVDNYKYSMNKRKYGSLPSSPKGVFDASFSCDSSNDSWESSSSPHPLSKKIKSHTPNTIQLSQS